MSFRPPDPQAPLGHELHPIHQSDFSPILGGPDYTPPGGGVWAKTVGGTAFHDRMRDVCNGAQRRDALWYVDEALKREQRVAWGKYSPESLALLVEGYCVAVDNVFRPRREDGWVAEIGFRYQDPETGYWYEGTIDLLNLRVEEQRIKSASLVDYKTGDTLPDLRTGPQHHEYSLAVKYGVLDHVPCLEGTRLLDWSKLTALPLIPRKWPKEFRFLHLPALINRGSWFALGLGSNGEPMTEADSLATMRALTRRLLEQQPTRLAVSVSAPAEPQPTIENMSNPQPEIEIHKVPKGWEASDDVESPRFKIFIFGDTGTFKTRSILEAFADRKPTNAPARLAIIDTENGTEHYQREFRFLRKVTTDKANIVEGVLDPPKGVETVAVDSFTDFCDLVRESWKDRYLAKEKRSSGNKGDYYTLQPRDYDNIGEEIRQMIRALIDRTDLNVIVTAKPKDKYAEGELMKKIGETFDAHKRTPFFFDVVIHLTKGENGVVAETKRDRSFKFPEGRWEFTPEIFAEIVKPELVKVAPSTPTYSWGEPRGAGYATDAQLKRIKANCDALGINARKVLVTAITLGAPKEITSVADVPERLATQLVMKLDALLKSTETPRPDREKTAAEILDEQIRQIIGAEIRTNNAKALRELMTSGSLTPDDVIDTMAAEVGADRQFNSLVEPVQGELLAALKRQANAKAERQLVATGAANGNGQH